MTEKLINNQNQATPEPPADLLYKIMDRIGAEKKRRQIRRHLAFFSLSLIGSVAAFYPAGQMLWHDFNASGFFQFFSLLFSDSEIVLKYWQNFLFSLLEALPIVSVIILLSLVWIFLESLKFFVRDLKDFQLIKHLN